MCGIFCCVCEDTAICKSKIEVIKQSVISLLKRRGPDSFCAVERDYSHDNGKGYHLLLTGSVLHLRGSLTPQPCDDQQGNILVWNGEIFGGIEIPDTSNDTSVLLNLLGSHSDTTYPVIHVLSKVQGPWSFVYWEAKQSRLWFGRDLFGRRSLLWHLPINDGDPICISSVAERGSSMSDDGLAWEEVPADGIYCLEMATEKSAHKNPFIITRFSWGSQSSSSTHNSIVEIPGLLKLPVKRFNSSIPREADLEHVHATKTENPFFAVSESSNATMVKPSSSEYYAEVDNVKTGINCGQMPCNCKSSNNLQQEDPCLRCADLGKIRKDDIQKTASAFDTGLENLRTSSTDLAKQLNGVLGESVRKRVFNLPRITYGETENCDSSVISGSTLSEKNTTIDHLSEEACARCAVSRVGILFSGGIDSIMLAVLADKYIPKDESIDLINVAFEQKPVKQNPTNKKTSKANKPGGPQDINRFDVPDRLTGRSGLLELAAVNPARQWNFVEVNITLEELQESRSKYISHLVSPLNSVLDDSIGCALWFAARGSGLLRCPSCISQDSAYDCGHPSEYTSEAKVLLVGMGADEQLGGYARHRTKFNQSGWQGLIEEIEMEVARISTRNLGRDDRCISDHGREARFPFLDENVVSFLNALPVWKKTDPRQPRGTGEKLLLRQAAKLLGLTSSASLPKRAIQFGSRIAKLESSSEKGSDNCTRFINTDSVQTIPSHFEKNTS